MCKNPNTVCKNANKNAALMADPGCPRIASFAIILKHLGFARGAMTSPERAWDERI